MHPHTDYVCIYTACPIWIYYILRRALVAWSDKLSFLLDICWWFILNYIFIKIKDVIFTADNTNDLHLKIVPLLQEPPLVPSYQVPIFTCTGEDITKVSWDFTIEQVDQSQHREKVGLHVDQPDHSVK